MSSSSANHFAVVEEDTSVLRCGEANDQSISHEDESETAIFKAPTTAFHFGSDRSDRSDRSDGTSKSNTKPKKSYYAESDSSPRSPPSRASMRGVGLHSERLAIKSKGNERADKVLEELTINKLNLKSLGLVGREEEKEILNSCLKRICPHGDETTESATELKNQLVFIKGYSGIGKSALARTLEEQIAGLSDGVYVEGKYELTSTDEPYSGVAKAFGTLCEHFKESDAETLVSITTAIKENMMEEAIMLMNLIPEIAIFFEENDISHVASIQAANLNAEREHERWKYAFRTFTRILGSYFAPIVMVLDDIQWADISSLDVIDYLVSDVQNPHPLMIIGCYRSNEVDENSILYNRIQTFHGKSEKGTFELAELELQNLSSGSVHKIIMMTMLLMDNESKTRELAALCFKRTLGNPFFLIEFMRMLHAEKLVEYNLGIMEWVWNVKKIDNATMLSDNVVDMLKGRMRKLCKDIQLLLQYAACLGSSFSTVTLQYVWEEHATQRYGGESKDATKMLKTIEDVQLVENCGSDELRWVHDKVQEAALSLSDLVMPTFQFDLGMCLYNGLESKELEKQIYDVADLINKGASPRRLDAAVLNLRAAEKARKMAAVLSAAKYAEFGIQKLPADDMWTLHRELTLQFYSLGAEMEYALGNIPKAESYIDIMLKRDEFTAMETLPLRKMKARILATAHLKWTEACEYGLQILRDIDFKFAWKRAFIPVQMLLMIKKLSKRLEKLSVHAAARMSFIQDRKQLVAVVDILKLMKHLGYSANDLPLTFLCVCKVVEMTLDHGISLCSADCFASLAGVIMFLSKDHPLALHICDLAFAFQKRIGRRYIADTIHGSWVFVWVHMKPYHECLHQLMEGYIQGLRDGDPLDSTNCLVNRFILLPYLMARPLHAIIKEFPRIAPPMEESGVTNNILTLKVWWQMMFNLTLPPSEAAKKLEGEHFRQSEETAESNMYIGNVNLAIGELLLYFGAHKERAKRLLGEEKGKTYPELVPSYPPHTIETFHRGITWFATMARKTGMRAYKLRAIKIRKEISKWAEKGNPNVKDYDLFLNAEEAVLNKKYKKADSLYKQAIVHTCRIGHLGHAALYNERFAEYRLEVRKDLDDAKYHMSEAIRYYEEWGALGKAEQLQNFVKMN
jgi:predicted ATPase